MSAAAALLAISLAGLAADSHETYDPANCQPMDRRFADNRAVIAVRDRHRYAFATADFARHGPRQFRGASLSPLYMYKNPAAGEVAVLFLIAGVRNVEAFYIFGRDGRIIGRKMHSSMASCIY